MKVLGHYVARPFALLAIADVCLFLAIRKIISYGSECATCYNHTVDHVGWTGTTLIAVAFLTVTMSLGLYNSDALRDSKLFFRRAMIACHLVFIPFIGFAALTRGSNGHSLLWYGWLLAVAILAFLGILTVTRMLLIWGGNPSFMKKTMMVVGDGARVQKLVDFIESQGSSHLTHAVTIDTAHSQPMIVAGRQGNLALQPLAQNGLSLVQVAKDYNVDEIVVSVSDRRGLPLEELLECKLVGVNVVDALSFWEREAGRVDIETVGAGWLTFEAGFLVNQPRRIAKRIIDIVVSLTILTLAFPICLVTALAIRLESKGPIFYSQERVGLNGKIFRVVKFRSMRTDAEKDGPQWAKTGDNRVTRVGAFIRLTRIDEIPQIYNVLSGDMSFIGPRPERPFFVEQLRQEIPYFDIRHKVRPGITGWAQVNYPYGASVEDAKNKLSYDLYYLKRNDLVMDFVILMQTVRVILFAQGSR